ncbi:GntR family transcriptional regulator [Marinobacterium mangrovicola]|uniref:GntR family transcriptional regulator n=1 Tax=Marinobacterium mangrovicola TaxID=1476959 RepID=A0A4R1G7S2_9GAMM|nr:GntR family transcriptional regulator [Marinobacterium mangrovicola]TCK02623.1 GntR family transcriptional regulator [Marinobacterium mangrovicola]
MSSMQLGQDERLPLYQRLRDEIAARIAAGDWLPGGVIPTEAELTKTYGIATGTVRKAVDELVNDGLLQRRQGRGTFVRRPNFDSSFMRFFRQETKNSEGVREVPEGRVLALRSEKPSGDVRDALSLAAGEKVIHMERQRLANGRVLFHEDIWLPESRFSTLMTIELSAFDNLLYPFYEEVCEQRIASAHEELVVDVADEKVAGQLCISAGQPIVVIERLASGYDKTPLEYRISRGSADTFRYQIDIA